MSNEISTQTQSVSSTQELHFTQGPKEEAPFVAAKRNVFTDLEREELKQIFREVLREHRIC